jgi:hypothetical protein
MHRATWHMLRLLMAAQPKDLQTRAKVLMIICPPLAQSIYSFHIIG